MTQKLKPQVLKNFISISFLILMVAISYATLFIDKTLQSKFPNTVLHPNGLYYICAAILLIILILLKERILKNDLSDKLFLSITTVIFLAAAAIQTEVCRWSPLYLNHGDFGSIMDVAIGLNEGRNFADYPYFITHPNNANIGIALSWLYSLIPRWRIIMLILALNTNLSAIFTALTVKNITGSKYAAVITLIFAEILIALTWRAFIVYTDNFGMIFIALPYYLYTTNLKYKMPAIIALFAFGTFIKVTILVAFTALLFHYLAFTKGAPQTTVKFAKPLTLIAAAGIIAILFFVQKPIREAYGLKTGVDGTYPKGWQFMFMVGQNPNYYGVVNSEDNLIRDNYINEIKASGKDIGFLNEKFLNTALSRIKQRGITGNIKYYLKKINVAYNDGYFHNVQIMQPQQIDGLENDLTYRLLWNKADLYYISANIMQLCWDGVLILLIIAAVLLRNYRPALLFETCILAVTLYLMLFEGRAKYLYMFLPVFIALAGVSFHRLLQINIGQVFNKWNEVVRKNESMS